MSKVLEFALVLMLGSAVAFPRVSHADKCADLATPSRLTTESAMRAIFCLYNLSHGGTLLPLSRTETWDALHAETVAKPLLLAKYRESGQEKGVLVVARQMLENGQPYVSHAQGAALSVYVFRRQDREWIFEKGKKGLIDNAGSYGEPPSARLMRLGPDKYGLLFGTSYFNMGEGGSGAFIVPLSESVFEIAGDFELSGDNGGGEHPWSFEGKLEAIDEGGADYLIRVVYRGTEHVYDNKGDRVAPKPSPQCYRKRATKYEIARDISACTSAKSVDEAVLFPKVATDEQ